MLPLSPCKYKAQISQAIRDGAEGFFATQYGTIARLSGMLCGLIFLVYLFRKETAEQQARVADPAHGCKCMCLR